MPKILQACNFKLGQRVFTNYIGWERRLARRITKIEKDQRHHKCQSGFMITTQIGPRQRLRLDAGWYHYKPQPITYALKHPSQPKQKKKTSRSRKRYRKR